MKIGLIDYLCEEEKLVKRQMEVLDLHMDKSLEVQQIYSTLEDKLERIKKLIDIQEDIEETELNVESETIKFNNPEWRD